MAMRLAEITLKVYQVGHPTESNILEGYNTGSLSDAVSLFYIDNFFLVPFPKKLCA